LLWPPFQPSKKGLGWTHRWFQCYSIQSVQIDVPTTRSYWASSLFYSKFWSCSTHYDISTSRTIWHSFAKNFDTFLLPFYWQERKPLNLQLISLFSFYSNKETWGIYKWKLTYAWITPYRKRKVQILILNGILITHKLLSL
jgi:hypothetical protein